MPMHGQAYTYPQYRQPIGHGPESHPVPPLDTAFAANPHLVGSGEMGYPGDPTYGNQFMSSISPTVIQLNGSEGHLSDWAPPSNSPYQSSPLLGRTTSQQGGQSGQHYVTSSPGAGYHDNNSQATPSFLSAPNGGTNGGMNASGNSQVARSAPVHKASRNADARSLSESSMSGYPYSEPGDHIKRADPGFGATSASYSVAPELLSVAQPQPPDRSQTSARSSRKRQFWCDIEPCPHGRPFGTRNDLERHKFSVHRIPTDGQKVYICQGDTCINSGKQREWPRKDNFKNHCKVAHPQEDTEDLVRRSEKTSSRKVAHPQEDNEDLVRRSEKRPSCKSHEDGLADNARIFEQPSLSMSSCSPSSPPHSQGRSAPSMHASLPKSEPFPNPREPSRGDGHQACSPTSPDLFSPGGRGIFPPYDSSDTERDVPTGPLARTGRRSSNAEKELESVSENMSLSTEARNLLRSMLGKRCHSGALDRSEDDVDTRHVCSTCGKEFPRKCDLKKHEERHKRRWGCTDAACAKRFGSKNDWKRHENLVHFQKEMWVCGEPPEEPKEKGVPRCVHVFYRLDEFRSHLQEYHRIEYAPDVEGFEKRLRRQRVGRQSAGSMWCGFCEKVHKLKRLDIKQWEERFDHIDNHYKRGERIEDWFPPDSKLPKKDLSERLVGFTAPSSAAEAAYPPPGAIDPYSSEYTSPLYGGMPIDPLLAQVKSSPKSPSVYGEPPRKRQATATTMAAANSQLIEPQTDADTYCCRCGYGPFNPILDFTCPHCNHGTGDCSGCR